MGPLQNLDLDPLPFGEPPEGEPYPEHWKLLQIDWESRELIEATLVRLAAAAALSEDGRESQNMHDALLLRLWGIDRDLYDAETLAMAAAGAAGE